MGDYQEAKKESKKVSNVSGSFEKKQKGLEQKSGGCPHCGAPIPGEALFCPECGLGINQPSFCPNCGAKTNPSADICDECKAWLLDGQCKFCYAELAPGAAFCAECGNPKDGIQCPDCGTLSIFDFCTKCGKPLTEGAHAALELTKNDPDAQTMVEAVEQAVSIEAELAKLEVLINSEPAVSTAPPPVKKERFSASKIAAVLKTGEKIDADIARRTEEKKKNEEFARLQEEEKKRAQLREAQARIYALEKLKIETLETANAARNKFKNKRFLTNQEARKFHNAMKPPHVKGWLCNFANVIHPEGPNGCGEPSHGGEWYSGEVIQVNINGPT